MWRRPLLSLAALAAFAYASLCMWLYVQQHDLMYFPQATRSAAADADFSIVRDGTTLRGWIVNAGQADPILYFGGNAERVEQRREQFARLFPDHSVYLLAYRGYGASEGRPSERALFGDALAFFDHVQARHAGQPVAVIGSSLGSGIAGYLASQRKVPRLVLIAPFDSMVEVARSHYPLLPVRWLISDRYQSAAHLAGYAEPVLVIRAGRDQVIPAASTVRLIESLGTAPRVLLLPEADHNSIGTDPAYETALQDFID